MPRITLKQFQMPDYASQVPNVPRSERPVQKIADLLYILHGVPWFKKKQEKKGESGVSDSKSGVTADEANEAVTNALVKGDSLEDAALNKARKADFGLDQAMPIELQLMGIRKPFAVSDAIEKDSEEKKDDDTDDDFEKALLEAERKREILSQDPFELSAEGNKKELGNMQRAAGLEGKAVDEKWGPASEKARQRALHPEDEDEKLWADTEMERYIDNAINRELWGD
jgi:hypothetical protein